MRKEFVIKRIDASPDGAPYVIVSLTSSKDLQGGKSNPSQFDPSKMMMDPSKMGDMVKDLNKMLSGAGGMMSGGGTSLKIDMHEYKEMSLSVGDKVYLELTKDENTGV
ncbi:MAG: hypothetical protein GKS07_09845 [Nitrosopumilus sp.]|nr:MAG: hypothetical protein GKS07_09845 [Nitrosopumilus sp.]